MPVKASSQSDAQSTKTSLPTGSAVMRNPDSQVATPMADGSDPWLIQRKCACGGSCPKCREEPAIWPRLRIGPQSDVHEREADNVSRVIMNMSPNEAAPRVNKMSKAMPARRAAQSVSGDSGHAGGSETASGQIGALIHRQLHAGESLPGEEQAFFEPRFQRDLSHVRVHRGRVADDLNTRLGAEAFTVGRDIFLSRSHYQMGSESGRGLLAHEITHVLQQSGSEPLIQARRRRAGGCARDGDTEEDSRGNARGAGIAAHQQVRLYLAGTGTTEGSELRIPRANKDFKSQHGCPASTISHGNADVWEKGQREVHIAETKPYPAARDGGIAREEAEHYVRRSDQSFDRLTQSGDCADFDTDHEDDRFSEHLEPGRPPMIRWGFSKLDGVLNDDTVIGPFIGDPSLILKARLTDAGAIGYWCTENELDCDASDTQINEFTSSFSDLLEGQVNEWFEENLMDSLDDYISNASWEDGLRLLYRHARPAVQSLVEEYAGSGSWAMISRMDEEAAISSLAGILESLDVDMDATVRDYLRTLKRLLVARIRRVLMGRLNLYVRRIIRELCRRKQQVTAMEVVQALSNALPELVQEIAVEVLQDVIESFVQAVLTGILIAIVVMIVIAIIVALIIFAWPLVVGGGAAAGGGTAMVGGGAVATGGATATTSTGVTLTVIQGGASSVAATTAAAEITKAAAAVLIAIGLGSQAESLLEDI